MRVHQLIELLSQMNPGDEVRIATQPTYPLQFTVANVVEGDAVVDEYGESALPEGIVYLATGDHPEDSPYASQRIWEAADGYY